VDGGGPTGCGAGAGTGGGACCGRGARFPPEPFVNLSGIGKFPVAWIAFSGKLQHARPAVRCTAEHSDAGNKASSADAS